MEHYGVRGIALEWFESYLNSRKQYVYINGETSQLKDISCGVPQGSVLGPLLFLIYINDLPNISKVLHLFLFADDTNIYYEQARAEGVWGGGGVSPGPVKVRARKTLPHVHFSFCLARNEKSVHGRGGVCRVLLRVSLLKLCNISLFIAKSFSGPNFSIYIS